MAGYKPLKITGNTTGLVEEREEFILPNDAYPVLQNAYVWRERILRKQGCQLLGRLQRNLVDLNFFLSLASPYTVRILTVSGYIIDADNANPGQITTSAPHNLSNGNNVIISNVLGATGYNNVVFTITVVDATNFTVGVDAAAFGAYVSGGQFVSNKNLQTLEPNASIVPGSVIYTIIAAPNRVLVDDGQGNLVFNANTFGTIDYVRGNITITTNVAPGAATTLSYSYYPGFPSMGIRTEELQNSANDQTIFFDQVYAYVFDSIANAFEEFIPGTTWNLNGGNVAATDFFWSTNYWVSALTIPTIAPPVPFFTTENRKIFWVTNNTGRFGASADPIRITDGVTWVNFEPPNFGQIDATNYLCNCLSFLPFRGRMVAFNTFEGPDFTNAINFSNRIRWSTIGNPFIAYDAGPPARGSWRDDIRGQGGFLDIPTSEDIISVGFVRDNLVIYCERSTWQLRYTGRSIAPFNIERVNSELGGLGPFSAIQFDTSLLGIGDKGVVECDSYKSQRIDIKIPDFVFKIQNLNNGPFRVHGIRNFVNRLAFWTVPIAAKNTGSQNSIFPSQRLVYNYDNDSWALFNDSLTCLGTYQKTTSRTWLNTKLPWIKCNFPWIDNQPAEAPIVVGGNQQGFILALDQLTVNDVTLFISNIVGRTTEATVVVSPNHNMSSGFVIQISGIPALQSFSNLNGGIFGIVVIDTDNFELYIYNTTTMEFSTPQLDVPGSYTGGGLINIRENFSIKSKKFNFLDQGSSIQMGFVDVLMSATEVSAPGAISMKVYLDYNDEQSSNTLPQNQINNLGPQDDPDTFFNSVIPTSQPTLSSVGGTKFWQRIFCATRASFLTLEYTLSNAQMAGIEQTKKVQIDAQILWIRKAGRLSQI